MQLSFEDVPAEDEPEIWKPVVGFEGYYLVSSLGRVRSLHSKNKAVVARGGILKQCLDAHGYPVVGMSGGGRRQAIPVHRHLAAAFLGPRPVGEEVCHKDGNPLNCTLGNLEYKDHKGNMEDMVRHGRSHPKLDKCSKGHDYTPENLRVYGKTRQCVICNKERSSAWYYANRSPNRLKSA